MKVLNLRCAHDHRFEGWFGCDDDFESQSSRQLVSCPVCGDSAVSRLPTAPRLNVSGLKQEVVGAEPGQAVQAAWVQAVRHMMAHTEDVGERFPEEARRIHYGEAQARGIRGQASREDADALREEGIEVLAVPVPAALKGPLQ
ncbi:DUF1178 family protein [uncultured Piscinibacter sp.]|uniref:DUF1178 family protein n=1 Tax=uncultured Piscinibacter sp. TaxID=1131835 RepID=UPI002616D4D4|nr:DUF1178 family protein [uncultured Piscinibacter sp.]